VSGFGFTTAALPTAVGFLAWGDAEPPTPPPGQEPESCVNSNAIQNSFKGVTVGPSLDYS